MTAVVKHVSIAEHVICDVLDRLANGASLAEICRTEGYPDRATIMRLCLHDESIMLRYTRARELGYQCLADDIQALSDVQRMQIKLKRALNRAGGETQRIEEVADAVERT